MLNESNRSKAQHAVFTVLVLCILGLLFPTSSRNASGDVVDLSFNVNLETSTFLPKWVRNVVPLEDGKVIINGLFNSYNGTPTGSFVRINSDGTLDTTFNNHVFQPFRYAHRIVVLSDGGFLLKGNFELADGTILDNAIVKIDADGNFDNSFSFDVPGNTEEIAVDSADRIYVSGFLQVDVGGKTENRRIVRLQPNGDLDESYIGTLLVGRIETQGTNLVATARIGNNENVIRFTENGSVDTGFANTPIGNQVVIKIMVQADGKTLALSGAGLKRIDFDGGLDPTFAHPTMPSQVKGLDINRTTGAITVGYGTTVPNGHTIARFLPDGTPDPAYTNWTYPFGFLAGHGVAPDGSVYAGEDTTLGGGFSINFVKSFPNGGIDTTFISGENGFQNIKPGRIRTIRSETGGKVYVGGDFDRVNGTARFNLARLNADGTLDNTFALVTGSGDNLFSFINDIYGITFLPGGKLLVNGNFQYRVAGIDRVNVVVLNNDGSIDPGFVLTEHFSDFFGISGRSQNHTAIGQNGGYVVATSNITTASSPPMPVGVTAAGGLDPTFSSNTLPANSAPTVFAIESVADGKFLIAGRYETGDINNSNIMGFIKRLNPDGSADATYTSNEVVGVQVYDFDALDDGSAIITRNLPNGSLGQLFRVDSTGADDPAFSTGTGANGKINVIKEYTDGRILIGGLFSQYNGQPRQNFAVIGANGALDPLRLDVNKEVLAIEIDEQGRVLLGGEFTVLQDGAASVTRSLVARLETLTQSSSALLDFDGDGRTDLSVFRRGPAEWYYRKSSDGSLGAAQFGNSTDLPVPADFTGDGKTDIAFFRPGTGEWFIIRSEDNSFYSFPFGTNGDIPAPGDFDGDGTSDATVFRPATGEWFSSLSGGGTRFSTFGTSGDVPVVADYNGDGSDDIAIYRPAAGEWWINRSTDGLLAFKFGDPGDIPVHGDYTGDGKTDGAVYRPSTGEWFVLRSEDQSFYSVPFGTNGDIPTPGDYDGDGKSDFAVFRPSSTLWFVQGSTSGVEITRFGIPTDEPLPAYYQQ